MCSALFQHKCLLSSHGVGGEEDSKDRWSTEVQLEGCVEIQTEVSPLDKGKGREKDGERQQSVKERGYTRQNP